jgi:HSP20 family molecular chaperone IbpA
MKSTSAQRPIAHTAISADAKSKAASREQISLRSLPDCLLAAYDGVSHRAFERFVEHGSVGGNESADWRAAENELFEAVTVDLQDTGQTLYALATVSVARGSQIAVAIEEKWLLISGHVDPLTELRKSGRKEGHAARTWIDWDDLYDVLMQTDGSNDLLVGENAMETPAESNPAKSRPFCVIELPAEVDVPRCTAVLSGGVIAIRMPKLERKSPIQPNGPALAGDSAPTG